MILFLDLDCQNLASLDFGMSDLEKEPFDLGIENFALRIETSPASVPTSEQVHSRGTEHIFSVASRPLKLVLALFLFNLKSSTRLGTPKEYMFCTSGMDLL